MQAPTKLQLTSLGLRPKIVGLAVLVLAVVLVASWGVFSWLRSDIATGWGRIYTEKQVLYSRERTLHPVMRELALAQKLADSSTLRAWAKSEQDPTLREAGLRELEDYRRMFSDHSYFFVVHSSLHYYFNDAADTYAESELRYTLDPSASKDGWYFATLETGEPYKLNVNYDDVLQVTKVWINVVIREGDTVLGMVGTGIDLSEFLKEVVASDRQGVINMFVDQGGALQAHNQVDLIDFHSITKTPGEQKTVYQLLDSDTDRKTLATTLERLRTGTEGRVETLFVRSEGRRYLVGASCLPQIGWYSVTLVDTSRIVGSERFLPFAALLFAALLIFTAALLLILDRLLLRRVRRLDTWVRDFAAGTPVGLDLNIRSDEIGRLEESFAVMSQAVQEHTADLEARVAERTRELNETNEGLRRALEEIKTLSGLLPICMYCKKIRDEVSGEWSPIEQYISQRSDTQFSHGMCPECEARLYENDRRPAEEEPPKP